MLKTSLLALTVLISLPSFAANGRRTSASSSSRLVETIEKMASGSTPASQEQRIVLLALGIHLDQNSCEPLLDGTAEQAVAAAPSWLRETAEQTLVQNSPLTTAQIAHLNSVVQSKQNSNIVVTLSGSPEASQRISSAVNAAYSDANARVGDSLSARITISKLAFSSNSFSIKCVIDYNNGQSQSLEFKDVPVGANDKTTAAAQFLVAVLNHREVLADSNNLRVEINALRYNTMKLLRVGYPDIEGHVQTLVHELENAFAKQGFLSMFERRATTDARAFLTLLSVKKELVTIARSLQSRVASARTSVPSTPPPSARTSSRNRRTGITSPVRNQSRAATTSYNDDSYFWNTYLWITDPSFMITHPWYWGVHDGSPLAPFMIFQGLTDHQRYDQQQASQIFAPVPQSNLQEQFSNPINPVFTNDAQQPVVDAWDAHSVDQRTVIQPDMDPATPLSWSDSSGRSAPSSSGSAWDMFRAQDQSPSSVPSQDSTIQMSPQEQDRLQQRQDDGSGWQGGGTPSSPSDDRDPNIRSS